MKKIIYLLTVVAFIAAVSAEATENNLSTNTLRIASRSLQRVKAKTPAADVKTRIRKADTGKGTYKAGKETVYAWDGAGWDLDGIYTLKYDDRGLVTEELIENYDGTFSRTLSSYDSNGMMILKLQERSEDGENYVNVSKTEREYDPIVKDLIIKNRESFWDGEAWVLSGNNYNRTVTRNADGNVTLVEVAVLFDGIYDPMDRIEITYGDNGQASTIKESVLNYDGNKFFWEDETVISNIVWDRTDGQIVDMDSFGFGANRIKSADQKFDEDEYVHVELTYDGNNFTAVLTGEEDGETLEGTSIYEELDDYGSYRTTETYTYTSKEFGSYTEVETITERYDAYGNLLESKDVAEYDGEEEIYEDMRGEVEYDANLGYPLTYILSQSYYDEELEEMVTANMMKVEFADYVRIVSDVKTPATADETVSYYTLQGMKVENPISGIYIRKQGSEESKVVIR